MAMGMLCACTAQALPLSSPRYVILVTIDGLRAEMVDDPLMPSPFLKMMSREGLRISKVIGVPPAGTYPSHTTLVTGEVPARHRVFYNRPFLWNKDTARISYWYADSSRADHLAKGTRGGHEDGFSLLAGVHGEPLHRL